MVRVGRDLCGSSSPTPLPKQGHLQQAVGDLVQAGIEYLQRRRLHNLPGSGLGVVVPKSAASIHSFYMDPTYISRLYYRAVQCVSPQWIPFLVHSKRLDLLQL